MRGHEPLMALRRSGQKPHSVWITDSDDAYSRLTSSRWPSWPNSKTKQLMAHIRIEAIDIPEALDLRCLVGLECHVASDRGDERFLRLFQAVIDSGASAVAGLSKEKVHFFKATNPVQQQ